jgi:pSer/pThr/pTyr-binding forkhead associated (FHA) protein
MGKFVIKQQGRVVGEANLKLGDTTIGRSPASDVVLDDIAVSGEHAVVKTVGTKSTIADLDSTNGTFVENNRIKEHQLKSGETVIIGPYALVYRDELNLDAPAFGKNPGVAAVLSTEQRKTKVIAPFAEVVGVEGRQKGVRVSLVKDSVELDNPGKGPARITRLKDGYMFDAAVGPGEPTLNGKPVPPGGQILEDGDLIKVGGTIFRFSAGL